MADDGVSRAMEARFDACVGAVSSRIDRVTGGYPRLSLWIAFWVLTFLRFPAMLRNPTFYAEEGNVYFAFAANHGVFDSLVQVHLGYFALFPNVAGVIGAAVPLELAPWVGRLLGLAGPAACAWVVIESEHRRVLRLGALVVVVFTFTMGAEWPSTIHAQFWFACAVVLMVAVMPEGRLERAWQYALAVVAGLTGVLACLVFPAFLAKWYRSRQPRDLRIGVMLGLLLVLHVALGTSRRPTWHVGEFALASLAKLAVHPFFGSLADPTVLHWHTRWTHLGIGAIFVLLLAGWSVLVIALSRGTWRLVVAMSLGLGVAGLFFALPPYTGLFLAALGNRYALAGVVPVLVALILSWDRQASLAHVVVLVLVALAAVRGLDSGIEATRSANLAGPTWAHSVEMFRDDRGTSLAIDPMCRVSENQSEQRRQFEVTLGHVDDDGFIFEVSPGQYDQAVENGVFVLAPGSGVLLSQDGWQKPSGFFTGERGRSRCFIGASPEPIVRGDGSKMEVEVRREDLRSITAGASSISIGYGRDFADALAKQTFVTFNVDDLLAK